MTRPARDRQAWRPPYWRRLAQPFPVKALRVGREVPALNSAGTCLDSSSFRSSRTTNAAVSGVARQHGYKLVVAEHLGPHRIGILDHHLGLFGEVTHHGVLKRIDVIAEVISVGDRRIVADVGGESGNGDVLYSARAKHLIKAGPAECRSLNARRQEEVLIARPRDQRRVVSGFRRAGLPSLSQNLPAMKTARIGRIKLLVIVAVALSYVDYPHAEFTRFFH